MCRAAPDEFESKNVQTAAKVNSAGLTTTTHLTPLQRKIIEENEEFEAAVQH